MRLIKKNNFFLKYGELNSELRSKLVQATIMNSLPLVRI